MVLCANLVRRSHQEVLSEILHTDLAKRCYQEILRRDPLGIRTEADILRSVFHVERMLL